VEVVSYQLSVISRQLSVISYQLSVISYQLSVISYQLSVISYQSSVVSCQLSVVSCQLSVVSCQLSVNNILKTRTWQSATPPSAGFSLRSNPAYIGRDLQFATTRNSQLVTKLPSQQYLDQRV
jgi:hypothetical protein